MNEWTFDYEAWKKQFDRLVSEDRRATRSMNRLLELHVDRDGLTWLLSLACDFDGSPGDEVFQVLFGPDADRAKRAERLSRLVRKTRKEILEFTSDQSKNALSALEEFEGALQSEAANLRMLSQRSRVPGMFLAWLITTVKAETGKPHYGEVCDLLEVAYSAHGETMPYIGADSIRKIVKRYLQNDPEPWFIKIREYKQVFVFAILGALFQELESGEPSASSN
jgi:hypothetical protein